jgi:hypothetical protein
MTHNDQITLAIVLVLSTLAIGATIGAYIAGAF